MVPDQGIGLAQYRLAGPHGPLWQGDQVVPLPPKALAVLWALVSQAGQVVTKAALREAVWADTSVSDAVLTTCIRLLRSALAEDATQPRYIATVHRLREPLLGPGTSRAPASPPAA